ncbi:hypothetical protein BGZ60DRAFT_418310 [Tricladium varicosporioides]|nr:hypothetical protein BGZ60DRAFT_418310 [Hymenoscyphus varicosporioides]
MILSCALTSDYEAKSEKEVLEQLLPSSLVKIVQAGWKSQAQKLVDHAFNHMEFAIVRKMSRRRSFLISKSGLMGQGPLGSQKGDKICILLGCPCPLIIRPAAGGYVIVGGAYVYGMMNNETMLKVHDGTSSLKLEKLSFVALPLP